MNKAENWKKIRFGIWLLIIFATFAGWVNLPKWITDFIISKIVFGLIIGVITGAIAGAYAESLDKLTNGLLKEEWTFEIFDIEFHTPILVIVTVTIEWFLFS